MVRHLPRKFHRLPLVAGAIIVLILGMWGGLLRLGWAWPMPGAGAVAFHGPLMVGGFLGTLISLERAVALGRWWTYLSPLAAALGAVCLLVGLPVIAGQVLLLLSSAVLVAVFVRIIRQQPEMFTFTMGSGAVAWTVGNALWVAGWAIPAAVPWWIAFLVLTIVGERLELSRFLPRAPGRQSTFFAATGIYLLGVILSLPWPGLGWAVAGAGMIAMAGWLLRYDLARRTVRGQGLTRFVAACLLSGYFWLALGGGLSIYYALVSPLLHGAAGTWLTIAPMAGPHYDAILHAVLLGFVFVMIFGHAPIIFPAVLGVRMNYYPRFYVHLILLEGSVALRIASDLAGWWDGRSWAGLLNALAIVLFLIQTLTSIRSRKSRHSEKARAGPDETIGLAVINHE